MEHPARIYVDESYGENNSFLIQASISFPRGDAEYVFTDLLNSRISQNPRTQRKEFKGGALTERNKAEFAWFLQLAVNIIAEISEKTPIRSLVTVDSADNYSGKNYQKLYDELEACFASFGCAETEIRDARDFIRQTIWLHNRLASMFPATSTKDVEVYFDNKYRLSEKFMEKMPIWVRNGPSKQTCIMKPRWEIYSQVLRAFFKIYPTTSAAPTVSKVTYIDSKSNFLIQIVDLVSNLTLNAIKYRMGVTNSLIEMKYNLLCSVFQCDPIDSGLLKSLAKSGNNVVCADPKLFSKITLMSRSPT